ncbi:MAG TPA: hypothetical protein VN283_08755 [Thiobacillus sp.]|nr:hypothetical protein [Thiobacillus sp.]
MLPALNLAAWPVGHTDCQPFSMGTPEQVVTPADAGVQMLDLTGHTIFHGLELVESRSPLVGFRLLPFGDKRQDDESEFTRASCRPNERPATGYGKCLWPEKAMLEAVARI